MAPTQQQFVSEGLSMWLYFTPVLLYACKTRPIQVHKIHLLAMFDARSRRCFTSVCGSVDCAVLQLCLSLHSAPEEFISLPSLCIRIIGDNFLLAGIFHPSFLQGMSVGLFSEPFLVNLLLGQLWNLTLMWEKWHQWRPTRFPHTMIGDLQLDG